MNEVEYYCPICHKAMTNRINRDEHIRRIHRRRRPNNVRAFSNKGKGITMTRRSKI